MSVNLFPTAFPPSNTPVVDQKGMMTIVGMAFWRAIFNRTGQDTGTPFSTGPDLVAIGTTQATALPIINDWNNISGGAGAGILLPAMTMGQTITVFNNSGGTVNMYPPVGAALNVFGVVTAVDAPYVSTAPDAVIFYYFSNTNIIGI